MARRIVSIWFRHLTTDWFTIRYPHLGNRPFVLRSASRGRMVITAANTEAEMKGIYPGMVLADARAIIPELEVMDDKPDLAERLLRGIAEWCIRFTPVSAVDLPDGIILDASGCSHLFGGDFPYLENIVKKINARGYDVRAVMADTPGVAWGVGRYGKDALVSSCVSIPCGMHIDALLPLPPHALRLDDETVERLHKLGLHQISQFISLPRSSLRRRFGQHLLRRLHMALGLEEEMFEPVQPPEPFQERLPCLEPIVTPTGIEIALKQLLTTLCMRLQQEQKGLRTANFKCLRVDGKVEQIEIGTNRPSYHVNHLFKLFEVKIPTIEPAMGIELFILDAPKVEEHFPQQEKIWEGSGGLEDIRISELIDRLAARTGLESIHRYLPEEHYWPERSLRPATSLQEKSTTAWRTDIIRPLKLLPSPERIEVTAPIPDYPPMLFRHKGKLHKVIRADGPERIEQEWWLQQGQHRDYYRVEDEDGHRYWLFRSGHYHDETYRWYLHGYFA